jgi:hypothetical protein
MGMEVVGWGSNSLYVAFVGQMLAKRVSSSTNWYLGKVPAFLLYIAASGDAVVLYLLKYS